jgi:type I restriction enzyme, R subunit
LITESLRDYTKKTVKTQFESLDLFLQHWTQADQKQVILNEMEDQGVFFEALADEVGKEYGAFDLICHVAFDQPPLTRKERAENVRKRDYFTKYGDQARAVLDALLNKFAEEGVVGIEDLSMLRVNPFDAFGTPVEIVRLFGGKKQFQQAIRELETALFGEAG